METTSLSLTIREVAVLRRLMVWTLAALIVIGGSMALYLRGQKKFISWQLGQTKANIEQYEKQLMPQVNGLVATLQNYSKTHPDITPLLTKYGMMGKVPPTSQTPAPAVPAPSAPPPKK